MKSPRLLSTCLAATLLMTACGSSPDKSTSLTGETGPTAGFLAEIPADTLYAFAGIEPVPGALVLEMTAKLQPTMKKFIDELDAATPADSADDETRMMIALLREASAMSTKEGIEANGMTASPRHAFYGIGVLPVMRFDLKDGKKFEGFVKRIETATGTPGVMDKFEDVEFRTFQFDDLIFMLRISGNEAVGGFATPETLALYLPHFAGRAKLTESMATSHKIEELATQHKFQKFGVGFLDIQAFATSILEPASDLNSQIATALDMVVTDLSNPACIGEFKSIAARFPQAVLGYDEFTANKMTMRGGLIMGDNLGGQLMAVKAPIPANDTDYVKKAPLRVGVGVDVQKLVAMAQRHAITIRDNPYVCEDLLGVNDLATQLAASAPLIPPVFTQVKGATVVINDVKVQWDTPVDGAVPEPPDGSPEGNQDPTESSSVTYDADGMFILSHADPVTLMDTLKLYSQALSQVTMMPDSQVRPIPELDELEGLKPLFGAMSKTIIGVAVGEGSRDELTKVVDSVGAPSPMVSMGYDYAALLDMLDDSTQNPGEDELRAWLSAMGPVDSFVDPTEDGLFWSWTWHWTK